MLKKIFRLPIQEWMKDKKTKTIAVKGDFFMARAKENKKNFGRFGILISAKVFKGAVGRNIIRRKIFEALRIGNFSEKLAGKDVLISVAPNINEISKENFEKSLSSTLNKIK